MLSKRNLARPPRFPVREERREGYRRQSVTFRKSTIVVSADECVHGARPRRLMERDRDERRRRNRRNAERLDVRPLVTLSPKHRPDLEPVSIDPKPRRWAAAQLDLLEKLCALVVSEMEFGAAVRRASQTIMGVGLSAV